MKKVLLIIAAAGFAFTTSQAFASDSKYPYAPLPDYAQQEMQRLVDEVSSPAQTEVKPSPLAAPVVSKSGPARKVPGHSKRRV
ncbi:MAG TPA: hypothetical protein VFE79_26055 [Paraburkholderia sp.]|nr:hypothetical protein [Paraburkholderia sp.]